MQLFKDILLTVAMVLGGILAIRFGATRGNNSGWNDGSPDADRFDDTSSDSGSCDSGDSSGCD